MKKKIGTVLDENLLLSAKQLALEQNTTLSRVFEEALRKYLDIAWRQKRDTSITAQTRGMLKSTPDMLREVMAEDAYNES